MRRFLFSITIAGICAIDLSAAAAVAGFNPKAVIPSQRRLQTLEAANAVLVERQPGWTERIKNLPDPFFRDNFVAPEVEVPVEVVSGVSDKPDIEILEGIAARINPTGTLEMGGDHYLLLDGTRQRVGDELSIAFEGIIYRVTISSVKRNSYTLRLNDEELRREFK